MEVSQRGHIDEHRLTFIPVWISDYAQYKVWDEITYPLPNFNGATVEVWEWISNFILCCVIDLITSWYWD